MDARATRVRRARGVECVSDMSCARLVARGRAGAREGGRGRVECVRLSPMSGGVRGSADRARATSTTRVDRARATGGATGGWMAPPWARARARAR